MFPRLYYVSLTVLCFLDCIMFPWLYYVSLTVLGFLCCIMFPWLYCVSLTVLCVLDCIMFPWLCINRLKLNTIPDKQRTSQVHRIIHIWFSYIRVWQYTIYINVIIIFIIIIIKIDWFLKMGLLQLKRKKNKSFNCFNFLHIFRCSVNFQHFWNLDQTAKLVCKKTMRLRKQFWNIQFMNFCLHLLLLP